ncbi:MAG: DUF5104 domain-containing protein [Bacteroides sp.]|nr:DUF5104 domain-containing protein [Eubacterium sp.]MCM1419191.1 DUF5104 domain-containing protein [Roseburia sp.]MCM1463042.1 DUF5104 domain-containing protein [Bacteroides sp.]
MKKIIALGTIFVVTLFLCCSCDTPGQGDELIRCLNERDAEGIKDLFCEKVRGSTEVDLDHPIK